MKNNINRDITKKRSDRKRGFTVLELVIIIAIIAILAAVAIPTFSSIVKRANISAKTQNAENINKIFSVFEITDGRPSYMHEAICVLDQNGFSADDFIEEKGLLLIWDRSTNRVAVIDTDFNEIFTHNGEPIDDDRVNLWQVVDNIPEVTSTSLYINDSFSESIVKVSTGVDLGSNTTVNEVIYEDEDVNTKQTLVRTNSDACIVKVSNLSDNVEVIGVAKSISVSSSAGKEINRLDAYGEVEDIIIESGNVVVKSGATVELIQIPTTSDDSLIVTEGVGYLHIEGDDFTLTIEDGAYVGKIVGSDGEEIVLSKETEPNTPETPETSETPITPEDPAESEQEQNTRYDFEVFDTSNLDYSQGMQAYSVGEDKYYRELIPALQVGGYIVLLTDVSNPSDLATEKDTILDLNGFVITNTKTNSSTLLVKKGGNVKIIDTSTDKSGGIDTSLSGYCNIEVLDGGILTVYDGNMSGLHSALVLRKGATAIIKGGVFENSGENVAIVIAGTSTLTIDSGEFKTKDLNKTMISVASTASGSTITINGGVFNGPIATEGSHYTLIDNRSVAQE